MAVNSFEAKYSASKLAALMHPQRQKMVVTEVIQASSTMNTYVLKAADGHELACFSAGDYITVYVDVDGNTIERPYSLSSSPKQAAEGVYSITVKAADGGYISNYIHQNWKAGTEVCLGAPQKGENYNHLRDASKVIAVAGGSGVTHFMSMAKAIVDGDVDCEKLSLFYCVNTAAEIMSKDVWEELVKASGGKLEVIFVVAEEEVPGCETGFITLDIIKKYCSLDDSSFFISGPPAMNKAVLAFLAPLNIRRKFIRCYMGGDSAFNTQDENKGTFNLTVHCAGETRVIPALGSETVLVALERAGYVPAAHCRSGKCGFCRAYVVSGDYTYADVETGVRAKDKLLGFIHPCCSYPISDMEIVITRA